jgi:hypothetical protein
MATLRRNPITAFYRALSRLGRWPRWLLNGILPYRLVASIVFVTYALVIGHPPTGPANAAMTAAIDNFLFLLGHRRHTSSGPLADLARARVPDLALLEWPPSLWPLSLWWNDRRVCRCSLPLRFQQHHFADPPTARQVGNGRPHCERRHSCLGPYPARCSVSPSRVLATLDDVAFVRGASRLYAKHFVSSHSCCGSREREPRQLTSGQRCATESATSLVF